MDISNFRGLTQRQGDNPIRGGSEVAFYPDLINRESGPYFARISSMYFLETSGLASPSQCRQAQRSRRTAEIANSLGTTKEKLGFFLRKHSPEDWKEAQVIRELRRKEEAEDEIDAATDLLQLNKANAKLKSAQWRLERVCRRIYGETKEPENQRAVIINHRHKPHSGHSGR